VEHVSIHTEESIKRHQVLKWLQKYRICSENKHKQSTQYRCW